MHFVNYSSYGGRPLTDIIPLKDLEIKVRCESKPSCIKALRAGTELDFIYRDGLAVFSLPEIREYEVVVIE